MTGEDQSTAGGRSLAGSASRGAAVTLGGQGVRLLVQLTGIAVLARLLEPGDYGLVAIVAVIIGIGELFRDFGLFSAAVQAPTLTDGQRDNLFWVNTGIGVLLAGLLCAVAPIVGAGFGDDRLAPLAVVLSATFVLNGISTQYRAMHSRHLRFGRLALSEVCGQVGGVLAGILLALGGAGYWALAAQQLTQGLVALAVLLANSRWLPGRYRRSESIRPFVGYGMPLLGAQLLNYLSSNVDTLTIGARFGTAPVGLYNRAFQLVMMPLVQVHAPSTRVALPVLSRLRGDRQRFADFLTAGQVVLLTLIGGVFAVLFAQAPAAVAVALGPKWDDVVPLFRMFLFAGFFQAANYACYWVFLAKGLTRQQLRYALATRPLMTALVIAGSLWGVHGVAAAYAAGMALTWPVALLWLRSVSDAPVGLMFRNGVRAGVVFAAASALSWLMTRALPDGAVALHLLIGSLTVIGAAGVACLLWPSFRRDMLTVVALRRHLRGDRADPAMTAPAEPALGRPAAGRALSTVEADA
jgi:PST family polysaccharide transporter